MTDASKHPNRISGDSLGDAGQVSAWKLPTVGKPGKVVRSAKREAGERKAKVAESIEDVPAHKKPRPMTADELKKIADEAQQEGYADGFKEGMEKGLQQGEESGRAHGEQKAYAETRQQLDDRIQRLAQLADRLLNPFQQQEEAAEKLVVDLAMGLARHLLGEELAQRPEKLVGIVQKAIRALPIGAKNITVYVNEQDAALLEELIPAQHRNWQVREDDSLAQGGCRVETQDSLVDFSIEQRLADYLQQVMESSDETAAGSSTDDDVDNARE